MNRQLLGMMIVVAVGAVMSNECAANNATVLQGLKSEKAGYPLGETVELAYSITNRGDKLITFNFTSSKMYDFWVKLGSKEVWRLSRGKMYAAVMSNLTLQPGETKTFTAKWNQKNIAGEQATPGTYDVFAKLTPFRNAPPSTRCKLEIGAAAPAPVPVTVREAVSHVDELLNRRVAIAAMYRGWRPDTSDPNCKDGPPVTRSDWAISDYTGCMYVTGPISLDPVRDVGVSVTVIGTLQKTSKGQVYLKLESATIQRPAPPAHTTSF